MNDLNRSSLARLGVSITVVFLSLTSCASTPKSQTQHQTLPFVGSQQVHRYQLANGLKLLVVEDPSSPTFAYNTWFKVGSRDEQVGYTGLAHLFEHMMFKQTKNLAEGQFDKTLESAGSEGLNAFTNRDYTAYVQELPKDKLELIVKLESDRMVNLIVDDKAFATEREVVQNERRYRNENSPDGLIYQTIYEVAFDKHSYRWPVIGYEADLNRMGAKEAREFYTAFYSPNHATIVVVGDVKAPEVLKLVENNYGALKPQNAPAAVIAAEPTQTTARKKVMKLNIQVQKIMMGYRVPEVTHPDVSSMILLRSILTGGKSSRLNRALVDTGIMSEVEAYDIDDRDPTLFIIAGNLSKGQKAEKAESVILKEIEKLARTPVSAEELERAKNILNYEFYDGLSEANQKARFLGQYETITSSFQEGLKIFQSVASLTPEDVQRVAGKHLGAQNRTTIIGVQK